MIRNTGVKCGWHIKRRRDNPLFRIISSSTGATGAVATKYGIPAGSSSSPLRSELTEMVARQKQRGWKLSENRSPSGSTPYNIAVSPA
ncbi:unnamed protein product [Anisakis simplex]|uniref:Reverse transcriptase domain-containing protein n=1 Tax=Anisakis simplex TaxID=6269 RepID=A0A0M3K6Q5_ANISI|nr:unnamed protein product [Anisakis simplex]